MAIYKVNGMYMTTDGSGYIIPRSHFTGVKGEKWCVVEVLTYNERRTHFKVKHCTMSVNELRQAFGLEKKERIDIL